MNLRGAVLAGHSPKGTAEHSSCFSGSRMRQAFLCGNLGNADFSDCDFRGAELNGVTGHGTIFDRVSFTKALLCMHLTDASFIESDFANSYIMSGELINTDLGKARNLSLIQTLHDMTLDHRTIVRSGLLPRSFYQSCGFPIEFVDFIVKHLRSAKRQPSCFISHSSKDEIFCKRLHAGLQAEGIRCFYAPKDLRIGAPLRDALDSEVASGDFVIVVLSEHSIASAWVEHEVEAAFERERKENRTLLMPIMINGSPMNSPKAWAANLRRQRNIGDFQSWKYKNDFDAALRRLCDDIKNTKVKSAQKKHRLAMAAC